jgi:chemotaxis protein CheD
MEMRNYSLNLGDVVVTKDKGAISCYGLGSCVGLFLYDRTAKIAAGAHIVLSGDLDKETTSNAGTAFKKLIEEIKEIGGNTSALRAKIVGGASLFKSTLQIGQRNIDTIKQLLLENKRYLAAQDVGGEVSRTAHFNAADGSLLVSSLNKKYTL